MPPVATQFALQSDLRSGMNFLLVFSQCVPLSGWSEVTDITGKFWRFVGVVLVLAQSGSDGKVLGQILQG